MEIFKAGIVYPWIYKYMNEQWDINLTDPILILVLNLRQIIYYFIFFIVVKTLFNLLTCKIMILYEIRVIIFSHIWKKHIKNYEIKSNIL